MLTILTIVGKKFPGCHVHRNMVILGNKVGRLLVALLSLGVLLSACGVPAESAERTPESSLAVTFTVGLPLVHSTTSEPAIPPATPITTPEVAATSRGPGLEATDPERVVLASGDLQLVEFFRFT